MLHDAVAHEGSSAQRSRARDVTTSRYTRLYTTAKPSAARIPVISWLEITSSLMSGTSCAFGRVDSARAPVGTIRATAELFVRGDIKPRSLSII
jgi:hypothetical protein